jgi:signal transduction histidine kinase
MINDLFNFAPNNSDLFLVGVTIASTGILGFIVFFSNKKSFTSRAFLFFSLVTLFWGTTNFLVQKVTSSEASFFLARLEIFFATFHAFSFLTLAVVFPKDTYKMSNFYKFILFPYILLLSALTLTPFILESPLQINSLGQVISIKNGPGIPIFGISVGAMILTGLFSLFRKRLRAQGDLKNQLRFVLSGAALTLVLILSFNFIFPAVLSNVEFRGLGIIYILPFVTFTAYAIIRFKLLNIKIIATESLSLLIIIVAFFQILNADNFSETSISVTVFFALLFSSVLLIRSVRREVEQREQLAVANRELGRLNEEKTSFLNFASHELRYAPTVIRNYSSLLLEGSYGELAQKVRDTIQTIFNLAQGDLKLVDDYLNVARIEQGKIKYDFKPVNLTKMVSTVIDNFEGIAKETNTRIEKAFNAEKEITIKLDESKIGEVLNNLVDNAVEKYAKGTTVSVSLEPAVDGSKVLIKLSDTGIGMSKETIAKLFQRFSRARNVERDSKGIKGSGLGLYLARQYVLAHGGRIWAESAGEGKGSVFFLELPAIPPENTLVAFNEGENKPEEISA